MLVSDLPAPLYLVFAFVFGATWGSFFNVAIYRWPRELSVVEPPSTCPACGTLIPAYRNVPIFAYLLQRGRAACCGARLTPRYVVVEVLSGLLLTALAQRFIVHADADTTLVSAVLETVSWFVLVGGLVVATFVDLEWMAIPDEVTIGCLALGLASMPFREGVAPIDAAVGAGAGWLVIELVMVWGWERWTGRPGMGSGDAKLMLVIGVFLGWQGALFAMVAGSFQGIAAWAISMVAGRSFTPDRAAVEATLASVAATAAEAAKAAATLAAEAATATAQATAAAKDASATTPAADAVSAAAASAEATATASTAALDAATTSASAAADAAGLTPESADGGPLKAKLPFGPFLALGAIEYLFFGERVLDWYVTHYL